MPQQYGFTTDPYQDTLPARDVQDNDQRRIARALHEHSQVGHAWDDNEGEPITPAAQHAQVPHEDLVSPSKSPSLRRVLVIRVLRAILDVLEKEA